MHLKYFLNILISTSLKKAGVGEEIEEGGEGERNGWARYQEVCMLLQALSLVDFMFLSQSLL